MSVRGYVRINATCTDGVPIETQIDNIKNHCETKSWNLIKIYIDESVTARNMDTPEFNRLLRDIDDGDYLLINDLSRIPGRQSELVDTIEQLLGRKVLTVSVDGSLDLTTRIDRCGFQLIKTVNELQIRGERERPSC
jgi:site-specific DNA recombinase